MRGCSWGVMRGCSGGACMVAPGGCVVAPGGVHGCSQGGHAWDMTRYGDTTDERAVRILLECILVINNVYQLNMGYRNF